MISSKKHFEEYKESIEQHAVKTFTDLESAAIFFSTNYKVSIEEAKNRIENDTNADWIVCPNGNVYVLAMPS